MGVNVLGILVILATARVAATDPYVPVVYIHAWSGTFADDLAYQLKDMIGAALPNVYFRSLSLGFNEREDWVNSHMNSIDNMIKEFCRLIQTDDMLQYGYNGLGHGQGGLFLRAVQEMCPYPPMQNLITLGSPHQGIYGIPQDWFDWYSGHSIFRWLFFSVVPKKVLNPMIYWNIVQDNMVPAQYWRDPRKGKFKRHVEGSKFLAKINNDGKYFTGVGKYNASFETNLKKLKKFVMVMPIKDEYVHPRVSEHFGWYDKNMINVVPFNHPNIEYGLKDTLIEMDGNGQLVFLTSGSCREFKEGGDNAQWFRDNIIHPYLNMTRSEIVSVA